MILLYTVIMTVVVVVMYPIALAGALFGKTHLWERLHATGDMIGDSTRRVWIHAASVGEARIAFSMACEVRKMYPHARIFISTITATGLQSILRLNEASENKPIERAFLAPLDHPWITGQFVRRFNPTTFMLVETELWPWLILSVLKQNTPITIINGKISKRAFRRYMIIHSTIEKIVRGISLYCVQSRTFAKRFHLIGVPQENIEIIGNVKFDGLPEPEDYDRDQIRRSLKIPGKSKIFIAGSTRPGEEKVLARSFTRTLDKYPDALMVIVPRHLNRVSEIENILDSAGLSYAKRSADEPPESPERQVLILDTMGELIRAFAAADAAFVGGSLSDYGGHNPLEPAALGIPVLFGPYMEQTGSRELLSEGAAVLVHNEEELANSVNLIFGDGEKSRLMATAGPAVVKRFKGTLARTLQCMEKRHLI